MKIEQLLAQHLYNSKELSLQGIGRFTLSPDFVLPIETDKDFVMPTDAVKFEYNAKATEDDALIGFIVQQTRKIRPLASADLDSFLMLGRQFLNIGKPFKIDGIGTLEKTQVGDFQFTQGHFSNSKAEPATTELKEKREDAISFASKAKEKKSPKKILLILGALAIASLIGLCIWYFATQNNNTPKIAENKTDTVSNLIVKDTNTIKKDSITPNPIILAAKDSFTFKLIIKTYPSLVQAEAGYKRLTSYGHKLLLTTTDSATYFLKMPFTKPLSDTAIARDSIRVLLGGKPQLEF